MATTATPTELHDKADDWSLPYADAGVNYDCAHRSPSSCRSVALSVKVRPESAKRS